MSLPWPCEGNHRLEAEVDEYAAWRQKYIADHPEYASDWGRPSVETAEKLWDLIAPRMRLDLNSLIHFPGTKAVPPDRLTTLESQAKQAFVVALDTAVAAGDNASQLTKNALFDTLAERWSVNYRAMRQGEPRLRSWGMLPETLKPIWHELQLLGLEVEGLYQSLIPGCRGLFTTQRLPKHGYAVHTRWSTAVRGDLDATLEEDGNYRGVARGVRVWLDNRGDLHERDDDPFIDDLASRAIAFLDYLGNYRARFAAERKYNVVRPGPEGQRIVDCLKEVRLSLEVDSLPKLATLKKQADVLSDRIRELGLSPRLPNRTIRKGDVTPRDREIESVIADAEGREHARDLYGRLDRLAGTIGALRGVRRDLERQNVSGRVAIRTGIEMAVNRRFHATNFWPTEVTGKDFQEHEFARYVPDFISRQVGWSDEWSSRGRWFRVQVEDASGRSWVPLAGRDISSSQVQILAVFLGLEDLEQKSSATPFKELLLDRALELHGQGKFSIEPTMARDTNKLQDALKAALMTRLYGSQPAKVAETIARDYPRGLGDGKNIDRLLKDKQLGLGEVFKFLEACREIASLADPCRGVCLRTPLDSQLVRWNPIETRPEKGAGDSKTEIYWLQPVNTTYDGAHKIIEPTKPDENGDYPVDRAALRRMLLPCLTHMLDAAFSAYVIDGLSVSGVPDVVAIHDSWLVPDHPRALDLLEAEIRDAGRPWLESLGPVYDDIYGYLKDTKYDGWFHDIREKWRVRVKAGNRWPHFLARPNDLYHPADGEI